MMNREQARKLTKKFRLQRILVVGDSMLDRYIYGTAERISPEAPVPIVRVEKEREMPGGAANVARNVRELGGKAVLASVVGKDAHGKMLMAVLKSMEIETRAMMESGEAPTTVKTRVVASRQQVARVDWDGDTKFNKRSLGKFRGLLMKAMENVSGVVIEDYGKGIVNDDVVRTVLDAASRSGIPTGFDPKEGHDVDVSGVTVVTPNFREACMAAGMPQYLSIPGEPSDSTLKTVGGALHRRWRPALALITLGQHGMYLQSRDGMTLCIPARAREVFDVSGAGDTVIAACVLALAAGAGFMEAAAIANYAAGVVVGKIGTAGCSVEELLGMIE